jgi:hypothetical protein
MVSSVVEGVSVGCSLDGMFPVVRSRSESTALYRNTIRLKPPEHSPLDTSMLWRICLAPADLYQAQQS